jgi:hypothetical protein
MPETAHGDTGPVGLISVERLEWGKACEVHDGPIVRSAEHRTLGKSAGFPADLAELCHPDQIGPVAGDEDFEPANYPHGTVLRPIVLRGRITSVLVRVRRRPEDGDGGRARLYYLARYLAAATPGHDPLVLFAALQSEPLSGLTQAEAAALSPLLAAAEPPEEDDARPFLGPALIWALSGVPMAITEPLPESTFFGWAAALWWLLPLPLRPLLSCGWGVAQQLSGRLLLAHSSEAAANAAVFSPRDGTWRAPAVYRFIHGGTEQTSEFHDQRLICGRLYAHSAFGFAAGTPRLEEPIPRPEAETLAPPLDLAALPLQPDLVDPATVRALRRPGLVAFDDYRLDEAKGWLESGQAAVPDPLAAFSDGLTYRRSRARAAAAALASLGSSNGTQARAEALLWRLLGSGPEARGEVARAAGPGAARGHLLRVLSGEAADETDTDLPELLLRLVEAAERSEAGPLPEEAKQRLTAALDRSLEQLDARLADAHARMLRAPRLADDYEAWLRRRSYDLLFGLGRWRPPDFATALLRLGGRLPSLAIDALTRWFLGHLPDPGDAEALATLAPEVRDRLARCVTEAWQRPGRRPAERREGLLAWCGVQAPATSDDPLLLFALGTGMPSLDGAAAIAAEMERGAVPPSLHDPLAVLALDRWAVLGERMRRQPTAWHPIVERLPRTVAYLLFESPGGVALTDAAEPLRRAYGRFAPSAEEIRDIMARWLPRLPLRQIDSREAAATLWTWTVGSPPQPVLDAVEVCRHLERGEWAPGERLSREEAEKVHRLVTGAVKLPALLPHREALWSTASRLWQMQLALNLFPADPLEPTASQLASLRRDPEWLCRHLDLPDLHPGRSRALRLALLRFHEVRYPREQGIQWSEALRQTVLWAVFEGVPFAQQGDLPAALEAFADQVTERIRLAARYLDGHSADPKEAARRVAAGFVAPLLREALGPSRGADLVTRLVDLRGRTRPRGWWEQMGRRLDSAWPWRKTIDLCDGAVETPAVVRIGGRITLSPSLRRLLERLLKELGEVGLRRELAAG